jgi:hypothetical protein
MCGEERDKQMRTHLVANKEIINIPVENDGHDEKFGKDGRYPKRKRHLPREGWKNHILPQKGEKWVNVLLLDDLLDLCEASRSKDASRLQLAHGQRYVEIDHASKGSQECSMKMGIPYQEE